MDQAKATVGAEDDGGKLATCGQPCDGAPRRHGCVSYDGEAVEVPLACARWRGRQGKASGASELARER